MFASGFYLFLYFTEKNDLRNSNIICLFFYAGKVLNLGDVNKFHQSRVNKTQGHDRITAFYVQFFQFTGVLLIVIITLKCRVDGNESSKSDVFIGNKSNEYFIAC